MARIVETYDKGEIDGPPAGRLEDPVECEGKKEKGEEVEDFIVYGELDGGEAEVGGEEDQQGEDNCASVSLGFTEDGRKHGGKDGMGTGTYGQRGVGPPL